MSLTPEQEAAIRALKIDKLTEQYIALRRAKAAIAERAKADVVRIDAGMVKLENLMLHWLKLYGLQSAPTPNGTPYLTQKTGATIADRDAFNAFVGEDFAERSVFFTNAISKDTVRAYMDENEGVPPPGVNWYSEDAVNFKAS